MPVHPLGKETLAWSMVGAEAPGKVYETWERVRMDD